MLAIRLFLIAAALFLLAYPLAGIINPGQFVPGPLDLSSISPAPANDQYLYASATGWIANSILAISLLLQAVYIKSPTKVALGYWAAFALLCYPFAHLLTEILSQTIVQSHLPQNADISVNLAKEEVIFLLWASALFAMVKSQQQLQPLNQVPRASMNH